MAVVRGVVFVIAIRVYGSYHILCVCWLLLSGLLCVCVCEFFDVFESSGGTLEFALVVSSSTIVK